MVTHTQSFRKGTLDSFWKLPGHLRKKGDSQNSLFLYQRRNAFQKWDFKGERKEKAQKCKPENTDLATWPALCLIGSRKGLFLHQQAPGACHIRMVKLEDTAGMHCHKNTQHCCWQHCQTWSKCILSWKLSWERRYGNKSPFRGYFYSHWTACLMKTHILQSTCSLSFTHLFNQLQHS